MYEFQPEVERILQSTDTVRIIVVDTIRIDLGQSWCLAALIRKMMCVVVGGALGHVTVVKIDGLAAVVGRFDASHPPHPIGIGTQQIDQDAVK